MRLVSLDIDPNAFPVSLLFLLDDGRNHRRCVTPDDDISALPQKSRDAIKAHWAGMNMTDWQAIAHPPTPPVTPADIKAEAERRILALLPEWKQRNLTARGVELVLTLVKNKGWTADEAAEAAAIEAQWNKVKAVRARSDELEATLPADFAGNGHWPA